MAGFHKILGSGRFGAPPVFYADHEIAGVAGVGEWDAKSEAGVSTIARSTSAASPSGGGYGLRTTIAGANSAFVLANNLALSVAAGDGIWVATWLRPSAWKTGYLLYIRDIGTTFRYRWLVHATGKIQISVSHAGGTIYPLSTHVLVNDRWDYVAMRMVRASADGETDGGVQLYANGSLVLNGLIYDNYDEFASVDTFQVGLIASPVDGFGCDYDQARLWRS